MPTATTTATDALRGVIKEVGAGQLSNQERWSGGPAEGVHFTTRRLKTATLAFPNLTDRAGARSFASTLYPPSVRRRLSRTRVQPMLRWWRASPTTRFSWYDGRERGDRW